MTRKIGVYICECGPNIAEKVDIDKVIHAVSSLNDIAVTGRHKLLCSEAGKKFLEEEIKKHGLTHLVIAACSPKQHEQTFIKVCENAGLNPYLFQLANIREQCAWITKDKEEATEKAIKLTKAAIKRVHYQVPLEKKEIECNPDVLIIGGGIAGIEAGRLLADNNRKVYIVEKNPELGGKLTTFEKTFPYMQPGSEIIKQKISDIKKNENIKVFTECEVEELLGFFGNFEVKVKKKTEDERVEFNVGSVILATGANVFDPATNMRYGYKKLDNVLTAWEFEKMNLSGKISLQNGKPPRSVAIIHCVGREEKGYCSAVCCMYSIKFTRYLKEKIPDARVSNFYSDLCLPGKFHKEFYDQAIGEGNVEFIKATDVHVEKKGEKLLISYRDGDDNENSIQVDMVILATAIEPGEDAGRLAEITGISQDEAGFFTEEHEKLAPVSTSTEGIYIIGCAQGPKDIAGTIVQAQAAAGKILSSLIPGRKIEPEVKTSHISKSFCIGCKTCISVCSYGAITFDEARKISVVNEVICRGCGNCVAACPSGAATIKHFTFSQLYQELMEAVQ